MLRLELVGCGQVTPKMISVQENKDKYTLSDSQREFYNKHGYLVISALIGFDIIYACKQRFLKICNGRLDKGSMTVMKEMSLMSSGATGEKLINKVQDIVYDDVFMTYTENPSLLDVVAQFLGPNIMAVHSMLINKPPGTSEHPPHQDLHYFPFRPTEKIIASWTAMEEVHRDNGCLWVVPGSHSAGKLYHHGYPTNAVTLSLAVDMCCRVPGELEESWRGVCPAVDGYTLLVMMRMMLTISSAVKAGEINKAYHGIVDAETVAPESRRVYLHMSPGDTVFFHPLLVHGSGPNTSKNFRKAISCHYASSECYYVDTTGTTQENIAREVETIAKKKGYNITFEEAWRYRSKLVRGVKCNL